MSGLTPPFAFLATGKWAASRYCCIHSVEAKDDVGGTIDISPFTDFTCNALDTYNAIARQSGAHSPLAYFLTEFQFEALAAALNRVNVLHGRYPLEYIYWLCTMAPGAS
jgi:hypothetical protein